jgi:hypothetical protein
VQDQRRFWGPGSFGNFGNFGYFPEIGQRGRHSFRRKCLSGSLSTHGVSRGHKREALTDAATGMEEASSRIPNGSSAARWTPRGKRRGPSGPRLIVLQCSDGADLSGFRFGGLQLAHRLRSQDHNMGHDLAVNDDDLGGGVE